jgi:hypothetical protein
LDERGLFICLEKCVLDQITGLGLWPSLWKEKELW